MSTEQQANEQNPTGSHGFERTVFGIILVCLGVIFLLRNIDIFYLDNWWALFTLIPAIASFAQAWRFYQANGREMTRQVRGRIVAGLFPLAIALIFLFNLDLGEFWPVLIILAGIAVILS